MSAFVIDEFVLAARHGELDEVKAMLELDGADINAVNDYGNAALHMACANSELEVVAFLLEKGANVNLPNSSGNTPLHWASLVGSVEAVKLLLAAGASASPRNFAERTPLKEALDHQHFGVCDLIVEAPQFSKAEENYQESGDEGDDADMGADDDDEDDDAEYIPANQ
ncbi:hypothetical protein H696_06308 [Fonticula alba]|uniref:Uncharacterized protein n=1 Tax=Fonticula alba TaxID=691883 RepID=A0A058YZ41_FONAL|nr:hypothetical protein H696_06308 [Fonticula alba]KCV67270.1 hypothetical protein H696_06308 [Fonticula alba]|eukprot:XP_009498325.1 hypothetical protein H696_06308 [Fonticula alba]